MLPMRLDSPLGRARLERLLYIGDNCPPLASEAFRLAVKQFRESTIDANGYVNAVERLRSVQPNIPEAQLDSAWVSETLLQNRRKTDKLELELKSYKTNLIKESVRMGHNELARHLYNTGDVNAALKVISRCREFCTTSAHLVNLTIFALQLSLDLKNYATAHSYIAKVQHISNCESKTQASSLLSAVKGICQMHGREYAEAARCFISVGSTPSADGEAAPPVENTEVCTKISIRDTNGRRLSQRMTLQFLQLYAAWLRSLETN